MKRSRFVIAVLIAGALLSAAYIGDIDCTPPAFEKGLWLPL